MSEETMQNEGRDDSELSDEQLEQAAGGAVIPFQDPPPEQLKVEEGEKVIVSAELNEVQKIIGPAELPNSLGEFEDNKG